jgi:hypothetical protein
VVLWCIAENFQVRQRYLVLHREVCKNIAPKV